MRMALKKSLPGAATTARWRLRRRQLCSCDAKKVNSFMLVVGTLGKLKSTPFFFCIRPLFCVSLAANFDFTYTKRRGGGRGRRWGSRGGAGNRLSCTNTINAKKKKRLLWAASLLDFIQPRRLSHGCRLKAKRSLSNPLFLPLSRSRFFEAEVVDGLWMDDDAIFWGVRACVKFSVLVQVCVCQTEKLCVSSVCEALCVKLCVCVCVPKRDWLIHIS